MSLSTPWVYIFKNSPLKKVFERLLELKQTLNIWSSKLRDKQFLTSDMATW